MWGLGTARYPKMHFLSNKEAGLEACEQSKHILVDYNLRSDTQRALAWLS